MGQKWANENDRLKEKEKQELDLASRRLAMEEREQKLRILERGVAAGLSKEEIQDLLK